MNRPLVVAAEVAEALSSGRPVVALESTIISHGFPYPENLECARISEAVVREQGAVPATIAVLDGAARVGLSDTELVRLASAGGVTKVSRRDVGIAVAAGLDGATTVSATMLIAELAGVRVFATGGIGGVHRGGEVSMDVSADLLELSRTSVCVICAGAKSVLDLGLTLEVLETHGVPVIGYRTEEFPAFYTRTSGRPVHWRMDSPGEIAGVLRARRDLGITGGCVVANPIAEEHELDAAELDGWIETALAEAGAQGVRGKDVTPFLLARLHVLSQGATMAANKQLVWSNARLAAEIATALAEKP